MTSAFPTLSPTCFLAVLSQLSDAPGVFRGLGNATAGRACAEWPSATSNTALATKWLHRGGVETATLQNKLDFLSRGSVQTPSVHLGSRCDRSCLYSLSSSGLGRDSAGLLPASALLSSCVDRGACECERARSAHPACTQPYPAWLCVCLYIQLNPSGTAGRGQQAPSAMHVYKRDSARTPEPGGCVERAPSPNQVKANLSAPHHQPGVRLAARGRFLKPLIPSKRNGPTSSWVVRMGNSSSKCWSLSVAEVFHLDKKPGTVMI